MSNIYADSREDASKTEAQILSAGIKPGQTFHASDTKRAIFWSNVDGKYYDGNGAVWNGTSWDSGKVNANGVTDDALAGTGIRVVATGEDGTLEDSGVLVDDLLTDDTPTLAEVLGAGNDAGATQIKNIAAATDPADVPQLSQAEGFQNYIVHVAGAVTTSYTPDIDNGDYHTLTISGTVSLIAPANMAVGQTLILEVDNTAGGSLVSPGGTDLVASGDLGVYLVTAIKTGASAYKYSGAAQVYA